MNGGSTMRSSTYATPFFLRRDSGNRFKCEPLLERTMVQQGTIPFLRSKLDPQTVKEQFNDRAGSRASSREGIRGLSPKRTRRIRSLNRKEQGWDGYIKPISKFNAEVHASARIPFERI